MGPRGGMRLEFVSSGGGFPTEKRSRIRSRHSFARQASIWAASPLHGRKTEAQVLCEA